MIDVHTINAAFRTVIRTLLAMPANSVRPANRSAPTGTEQFATVLVTGIRAEGEDEQRYANAAGQTVTETVEGQRRATASVQFFRADAMSKATRLGVLLRTSAASDSLRAAGLGFIRAGPVRDLSGIDAADWEERAQIDIELYCIASEQISAPTYGRFPVSIDIDDPAPPQTFEVFEP